MLVICRSKQKHLESIAHNGRLWRKVCTHELDTRIILCNLLLSTLTRDEFIISFRQWPYARENGFVAWFCCLLVATFFYSLSFIAFNVEFHTFCKTLSHIDTENARFPRNICIRNVYDIQSVCNGSLHAWPCKMPTESLCAWNEKREWILICALKDRE